MSSHSPRKVQKSNEDWRQLRKSRRLVSRTAFTNQDAPAPTRRRPMPCRDIPPTVIRSNCFEREDRAVELQDRNPNLPFNRRADSYRVHAVVQRRLATWLAEWIEPAEKLGKLTALEVGAGDGLFTDFLVSRCPQLTATDIAHRMVELGKQRLPQVDWCVSDAWQLESRPVDRLYSASLLHWCDDPAAVLRRWRRFVNPNGRMLHGCYVSPTLTEWQSIAGDYSPVQWRDALQWQALLSDAGWRIVRCETTEHVQRFDSARHFFRFLHCTGAVPPRQTPVTKLRCLIREYQRRFASNTGPHGVRSTWTLMRVEAICSD